MEKLPDGKNAKALAKVVARLLFPFRGIGVRTITTDNGCEFCAHEDISKMIGNVPVFFADSYTLWQKGAIENENKLIWQYIPKGTDFDNVTPLFIKKYKKTQQQTQIKTQLLFSQNPILQTFVIILHLLVHATPAFGKLYFLIFFGRRRLRV
jgi:IS30 family transposase